jgi:hypothetical protein
VSCRRRRPVGDRPALRATVLPRSIWATVRS